MRFVRMAATAAALMAVVGGAQADDWSKIRIGTEGAYPPFNVLSSDGQLSGFDIDIANALCEQMQAECEFVTQDWDGMIPALQAGRFDAVIASMSITEERLEQVDFTDKYYSTPPAIAVPKDSTLTGTTDEELAGVALGAQSATTHSNFAEKRLPSANLRNYQTALEYQMDIAIGRIDAVIDDVVVLSEWLESEEGACCKLLGTKEAIPSIYGQGVGIALRKSDSDLTAKFNEAIAAILENGTYQKINDKHFSFNVYGG